MDPFRPFLGVVLSFLLVILDQRARFQREPGAIDDRLGVEVGRVQVEFADHEVHAGFVDFVVHIGSRGVSGLVDVAVHRAQDHLVRRQGREVVVLQSDRQVLSAPAFANRRPKNLHHSFYLYGEKICIILFSCLP